MDHLIDIIINKVFFQKMNILNIFIFEYNSYNVSNKNTEEIFWTIYSKNNIFLY